MQSSLQSSKTLIEIRDLTIRFKSKNNMAYAVNGISYALGSGETLGVVGESGCGKSAHALSIMKLLPIPPAIIVKGEINYQGRDLLKLSETEMQKVRGSQISMIFQDPMTSLNPVLTVGFQISESLRLHKGMGKEEARKETVDLLRLVGIPQATERLEDFPHQFSGGMRQRAMIAMALSCNPSLLIADEPTTALDVTIQAQIIDLVKRLRDKLEMAIIWITHDLGVVARLAHTVNVMYAGKIVERGPVNSIFLNPSHPYTLGLMASLPRSELTFGSKLFNIRGEPPNLTKPPIGCLFASRCSYATDKCRNEEPSLEMEEDGHFIACWEKERAKGTR